MKLRRPALRWHGGKWMLAPWIIGHFPVHRIYVEPFGGGASVLLRKDRYYAEIYNDLDQDVVNFFRAARDHGAALQQKLFLTPFARDDFMQAYEQDDDIVERARRMVVRSFMGFGSNAQSRSTGFRANANRAGSTPAHDWANYAEVFPRLVERLRGVVIENKDASDIMLQHDGPGTLHYVDPPYVHSTRSDLSKDYAHELTDAEHADLLALLRGLKGMVVLSGYASPLYDRALSDWHRVTIKALADGASEREEVLWINAAARQPDKVGLFAEVAA